LTTRHSYEDLLRAVVEGVCFAIKDLFSILHDQGVNAESIRVGGGGANSTFWLRTLASVLGRPVIPVATTDATAFGAAILSASAAWGMSLQELAREWVEDLAVVEPAKNETEVYEELHPVFQRLYDQTREQMAELSNLARSAEQHRGQD
jgi:sugar (pentulose or hexulose) kinase